MAERESEQLAMMRQMVALAENQTAYSRQRSEMSEARSYQNAERTLSVWVRTALALMICGLAIDRFGLMLDGSAGPAHMTSARGLLIDNVSTWTGIGLVLLGVFMVMTTGVRFLTYALAWQRQHEPPAYHGPYLASFFALMVAVFGVVLLVIMIMV